MVVTSILLELFCLIFYLGKYVPCCLSASDAFLHPRFPGCSFHFHVNTACTFLSCPLFAQDSIMMGLILPCTPEGLKELHSILILCASLKQDHDLFKSLMTLGLTLHLFCVSYGKDTSNFSIFHLCLDFKFSGLLFSYHFIFCVFFVFSCCAVRSAPSFFCSPTPLQDTPIEAPGFHALAPEVLAWYSYTSIEKMEGQQLLGSTSCPFLLGLEQFSLCLQGLSGTFYFHRKNLSDELSA